MKCMACGRPIRFLRQLRDVEFCSDRCRRRGERPSPIAMLEQDEDLPPLVSSDPEEAQSPRRKSRPPLGIAVLLCLVMIGLLAFGERNAGTPPVPESDASASVPPPATDNVFSQLWSRLAHRPVIRLQTDFSTGFEGWQTVGGLRLRRNHEGLRVDPGALVLWTPSMKLADYRFEFKGQVEKKALSWVYRSRSPGDYYRAQLLLSREGSPQTIFRRLVVMGGETVESSEFPAPFRVETGKPYVVAVEADGSRFVTTIDGRVVDVWEDLRLHYGGVGFAATDGEAARIYWAKVIQRQSRFRSLFSAFLVLSPDTLAARGD